MIDLDDIMQSRYVDGGRELPTVDCWGLVRIVFYRIHGLYIPLLDKLNANSIKQITTAYRAIVKQFVETEPAHGAIVALFTGSLCTHIGIVIDIDGSLYVLETTPDSNARVTPLKEFEADNHGTKYYTYA